MMSTGQTKTLAGGIAVRVHGVGRVFRDCHGQAVPAIQRIDLLVEAGEFVAVLGPSGCGKSTLLRLVAGLDRPDTGTVTLREALREKVEQEKVESRAGGSGASGGGGSGGVAYVFQDAHLLPWRDVVGNVTLPLELMGLPRGPRAAAARAALEAVGLSEALGRYPGQLSGGMRMRVSLARALVTRPRLLLMDEPFAALDEITRQGLDEQLRGLWAARGMTVIFVTHSIAEAVFLADRAVVLTRRPARVVADRATGLGPERIAETRATAEYAHECGVLYESLRRGEGGA
jgi:NitT/TauT family transport system ATP-binding protein